MSWDVVLQKKQEEKISKACFIKILKNIYPKLNTEEVNWLWLDADDLAFEVDVSDTSFIMFHIREIKEHEFTTLFKLLSEKLLCGVWDTTTGKWFILPPED